MQTRQANRSAPSATEFDLEQTKWKMNSPVSMDEPPAALIAEKKLLPTSICRFLAINQVNHMTAITAAAMGGIEMTTGTVTYMLCGHKADARDAICHPICSMCLAAHKPEATRIDPNPPALTGRVARCDECGKEKPSNTRLAYFAHRPAQPFDSYYCGCRG